MANRVSPGGNNPTLGVARSFIEKTKIFRECAKYHPLFIGEIFLEIKKKSDQKTTHKKKRGSKSEKIIFFQVLPFFLTTQAIVPPYGEEHDGRLEAKALHF